MTKKLNQTKIICVTSIKCPKCGYWIDQTTLVRSRTTKLILHEWKCVKCPYYIITSLDNELKI